MKRLEIVLGLGIIACLAGYLLFSANTIKDPAAQNRSPELEWLKTEFRLEEDVFARISGMHRNYEPQCQEMCRQIREKNLELQTLISATNIVTPEIVTKIGEATSLRMECQIMMLRHFYQVSEAMPPAEGRRYLARMKAATSLSTGGSFADEP